MYMSSHKVEFMLEFNGSLTNWDQCYDQRHTKKPFIKKKLPVIDEHDNRCNGNHDENSDSDTAKIDNDDDDVADE